MRWLYKKREFKTWETVPTFRNVWLNFVGICSSFLFQVHCFCLDPLHVYQYGSWDHFIFEFLLSAFFWTARQGSLIFWYAIKPNQTVWFYGISTIVGYLKPNPVYTYILNIYMICKPILQITFLNEPELFFMHS